MPATSSGEKFFPDNVVSMSEPDATTIVLNLTQSYNPTWFLYNELSQITPLPLAWDRTLAQRACPDHRHRQPPRHHHGRREAVYKFLDGQSKATNSWASSPLWAVVDGPFKLLNYTSTGEVDLVPNPTYSGSPKPTISKFVELPFTDNNAELTTRQDQRSERPDDRLPAARGRQAASRPSTASGYSLSSAYTLSYNFFPLNLNNPTLGPDVPAAVLPPGVPASGRPARLDHRLPERMGRRHRRADPEPSRPTRSPTRLEANNPYPLQRERQPSSC